MGKQRKGISVKFKASLVYKGTPGQIGIHNDTWFLYLKKKKCCELLFLTRQRCVEFVSAAFADSEKMCSICLTMLLFHLASLRHPIGLIKN